MAVYFKDYFNKSLVLLLITCRQSLKNTADWHHRQTLWKYLSKLIKTRAPG